MQKALRWVVDLFWQHPTPFTFLIFVVLVLLYVLKEASPSEVNQTAIIWGMVLLLLAAGTLVVISLLPATSPSVPAPAPVAQPLLSLRQLLYVQKHLRLENGQVPGCANHAIGRMIHVSQANLNTLYNRLLGTLGT
jgi:hypothetical protein